MKIRPAVEADAPQILDITKKSFLLYQAELSAGTSLAALSETLERVLKDIRENTVFVAENEHGAIVGSIRCQTLSPELAYVFRFGVDPAINNSGVGSMLLQAVIEVCGKAGLKAVALHTNSKYFRLARYYYGKGFYVHSTNTDKGYIRALFVLELTDRPFDLSPAFLK